MEPKLLKPAQLRAATQQTQHRVLAPHRRNDAQSHVDIPPAMAEPELAILRPTRLRQIQRRHHLEPLHQRGVLRPRRPLPLLQRAIDAKPQVQIVLIGPEMDIRSAVLSRSRQHLVDRRDDRRVVIPIARVVDRDRRRIAVPRGQRVRTRNQRIERLRLAQHRPNIRPQHRAKPVNAAQIERVGHANRDNVINRK